MSTHPFSHEGGSTPSTPSNVPPSDGSSSQQQHSSARLPHATSAAQQGTLDNYNNSSGGQAHGSASHPSVVSAHTPASSASGAFYPHAASATAAAPAASMVPSLTPSYFLPQTLSQQQQAQQQPGYFYTTGSGQLVPAAGTTPTNSVATPSSGGGSAAAFMAASTTGTPSGSGFYVNSAFQGSASSPYFTTAPAAAAAAATLPPGAHIAFHGTAPVTNIAGIPSAAPSSLFPSPAAPFDHSGGTTQHNNNNNNGRRGRPGPQLVPVVNPRNAIGQAVLFVGQLNWDATEMDVGRLFSYYGTVLNVVLLKDQSRARNGKRRDGAAGANAKGEEVTEEKKVIGSSAFVTFGCTDEADLAIISLHNKYCMDSRDKPLQVSYCQKTEVISDFGYQHARTLHELNSANPIPAARPRPIQPPQSS